MDIEEHLSLHDSTVRAWVWVNVGAQGEFYDDAYQNIVLAMIEAHEGAYDHSCQLLTYIWPHIRGIGFRGIHPEYRYGITEELDMLQEIAEEQGRDRLHLDRLYDSPIPGLKTVLESTLTPEEQEQATKLLANLTDEDREILEASYGRSIHQTAEFLGIPYTTCWRRLKQARERAAILLKLLS